jgi:hypothetical protein
MGKIVEYVGEQHVLISYIDGDTVKSAFQKYQFLYENNIYYLEVIVRNTHLVGEEVLFTVYETTDRHNETQYTVDTLPYNMPSNLAHILKLLKQIAAFTERETERIAMLHQLNTEF